MWSVCRCVGVSVCVSMCRYVWWVGVWWVCGWWVCGCGWVSVGGGRCGLGMETERKRRTPLCPERDKPKKRWGEKKLTLSVAWPTLAQTDCGQNQLANRLWPNRVRLVFDCVCCVFVCCVLCAVWWVGFTVSVWGFQGNTTAQEPKRVHLRVPVFTKTTKIQREDP